LMRVTDGHGIRQVNEHASRVARAVGEGGRESALPSQTDRYDLAPSQPRRLAGGTVEAGPLPTDSDFSA
jgi:hypothetical protein